MEEIGLKIKIYKKRSCERDVEVEKMMNITGGDRNETERGGLQPCLVRNKKNSRLHPPTSPNKPSYDLKSLMLLIILLSSVTSDDM